MPWIPTENPDPQLPLTEISGTELTKFWKAGSDLPSKNIYQSILIIDVIYHKKIKIAKQY